MMEKREYLVVTFHTTAAAMALEKRCHEQGIAGRLIPVPRAITADCGMAWRGERETRDDLEHLAADLEIDGWYELTM